MTDREQFEAWYATTDARFWNTSDAAFAAWRAAVKVEREACAKICDERKWRGEPLNFAEYCAEEIRMRSNAC